MELLFRLVPMSTPTHHRDYAGLAPLVSPHQTASSKAGRRDYTLDTDKCESLDSDRGCCRGERERGVGVEK